MVATSQDFSERARKAQASRSPEARRLIARKAVESRRANALALAELLAVVAATRGPVLARLEEVVEEAPKKKHSPWGFFERSRRADKIAALKREVFGALRVGDRCRCAKCDSTHDLEVDHVDGRDWQPRNHNQETRWRRYATEIKQGKRLRILCSRCNGTDGYRRSQKAKH